MTEDEMVGWHHRPDGYEFEQAPEVGDGQESLATVHGGPKELDTTERLNWWLLPWFYMEADVICPQLGSANFEF